MNSEHSFNLGVSVYTLGRGVRFANLNKNVTKNRNTVVFYEIPNSTYDE